MNPDQSPLSYDVVALPADLLPGRRLAITQVVRDGVGIRIEYDVTGPVISPSRITWFAEGMDDLGNGYEDVGGAYGPSADGTHAQGVITMPLPQADAAQLRIRFSPCGDTPSVWSAPAYELMVQLR